MVYFLSKNFFPVSPNVLFPVRRPEGWTKETGGVCQSRLLVSEYGMGFCPPDEKKKFYEASDRDWRIFFKGKDRPALQSK